MSKLIKETVTSVHHWNETLFSFTTTRHQGLRFKNGHFTMIGLEIEDKPLLRAYSIASANYEDEMEFFSIKVQDGPLTQHLQKLAVGDELLVGTKPVGTLIADNLLPGKNLYLLSTGTGLAPFMSIIKDYEVYQQFDKVILTHGVRQVSELAYKDRIENELPQNEYFGEEIRNQLIYYPTVTREAFRNQGRLTDLITSGKLFEDIGLPAPDPETDRFMLCGSPAMLNDLTSILEGLGFEEARAGKAGHFVIERAFVEK
ncbi:MULTISPECIES: ferredoxin--NADP reductase [unclassified Oceanobacter]|uniref:ferredoxin--NADP reductase n=1 Tax=unclassified Oceanobacter TaxID=2620260 RepID=UPI0026E2842E|nr:MULTISPECIES: ferredoxin--NADP reductase [unclassified Oceanobacter]MDO6682631.1 ferredoxin--NADP reductase [Oceanobacter sp. 5_MG-2023]MDP2506847.1 ferredoxin--NADP reductase [Oceanobacter sp. 3_MG-2023]MDP2547844.1 ferredoxin--NADP reductase [Oceanobacter sp. 4_MG-2023]MDP2608862.1 ferredoxin--NADP reductase [Oceanobacter sp. 1_MG-2023]MDP2611896.1 ferredoxin--NADP reductase [Oceanobacter sp. 2_MG-2023]